MAYTFEKISYENENWYVHLLISTKEGDHNMRLSLENASGQTHSPDYRIVTSCHQIDDRGVLFVSTVPNHRGKDSFGLHPLAVRYATQGDFDKFCYDNPDSRLSFDWNAEVWRAFQSSAPAEYSPASDSDAP